MRLSHQSKPFRPGAEGGGNAPLGFTLPRFSRPVCALHGTFHETLTDDPLIDWESVKGYVDDKRLELLLSDCKTEVLPFTLVAQSSGGGIRTRVVRLTRPSWNHSSPPR